MVCFIISAQFVSLSFLIFVPVANATTRSAKDVGAIDIRDQIVVPLGDYNDIGEATMAPCFIDKDGNPSEEQCWHIPWLAKYIGNMYRYGVVIGSILAVLMIMIGGVMYLIGGLNPNMIKHGKELITGAVTGLVLLLGSYVLLNTINPNLVNLQPIKVEVVKEAIITDVKFCNELPADKYIVEGDSACGKKMTYKARDTSVSDRGECFGWVCPGTKTCVPASPTDSENFACRNVLIWGSISDPNDRYLDKIWLYPIQGSKLGAMAFYNPVDGKGQQTYYIYQQNLTDLQLKSLGKIQYAVLKIELNDDSGTVSMDDEYYVGRDPKVPESSNVYKGVWINPTCSVCGAAHPAEAGAEGDKWVYDTACGYFNVNRMLASGMRIDIDNKVFREDEPLRCEIIDNLNPSGAKLPIGEPCGKDAECASDHCETQDVPNPPGPDVELAKCTCSVDADCGTGEMCQTAWGTFNQCRTCKGIEQAAATDAECCSNFRDSSGICKCKLSTDCPANTVCINTGATGYCKNAIPDGDLCTADEDCLSGDCHESSWYGLGTKEKRCQCDPSSEGTVEQSCGKGKWCMEVQSNCGWNYCTAPQHFVSPVPSAYNPLNDPEHTDEFGLCDASKPERCVTSKCIQQKVGDEFDQCRTCSH
ncbi:MAG: hypothetical protein UT32_C0018G0038 [Parcubacteria group bacterium GW2011_GWC2_39_14]|nr:MAG: hypothetical protein UT32_C0018G0038 [Parcubacteria group bacterium GW2011_GWC2_39_14]KKR54745.1 MAG: hypothetical protein UT91_C0010G0038 [Parcubacteria group bacterium GW2011_GWA2_40_23]